ncbi:MAG: YidC/Oxa1 family membrane protein insertase [Bacillota bacterium]|nr:membrane protein insertase YidC [Bacillota bacterium]
MSITSIMESIIRYFADLTGNPGWSIIIVTVLIKIITHPLSVSQIRSMEQIKVVTPKVKELEAKYKGQPQEYQRRLAELYRDNKINPLAGCLPSLIPLPILIVFFRVLQNREFVLSLKGAAEGFLWMRDFSVADPTYIMPILSAATTWLSMAQTITDQSQKSMTIIMPLMMGWFATQMPAGAAIYWVVTNIVTMIQHWVIKIQLGAKKEVAK